MVVSGSLDPGSSTFYLQDSLIIWPNLQLRRHSMAEEAFICLGDTWGGKHVKTFEIQSRKTETMLLAEFFIQNHLYTFRCWTASDLFTITADDSSPVEVDQ